MPQTLQCVSLWNRAASRWIRSCTGMLLGVLLVMITQFTGERALGTEPTLEHWAAEIVEMTGKAEVKGIDGIWKSPRPGLRLQIGDQLHVLASGRMTLRLTDQSLVRIREDTWIELRAPVQPSGVRRFFLRLGSLFFLNRERPSAVEFETPLASGAIRGTEFALEVGEGGKSMDLNLFEGHVSLEKSGEKHELIAGQRLVLSEGGQSIQSHALSVASSVQWAFYYPAILVPEELALRDEERARLEAVLQSYRSGAVLLALEKLREIGSPLESPGARTLAAGLQLTVGRSRECAELLEGVTNEFAPAKALQVLMSAVQNGASSDELSTSSPSGWLARSYQRQIHGDWLGAWKSARKATELAPESGAAWLRRAEVEMGLGRWVEAQPHLGRGIRLAPRHPMGPTLAGYLSLERGDVDKAVSAFDQALALEGSLAVAWTGRGLANQRAGARDQARSDFQMASILEPHRALYRSYLAKLLAEHEESQQASKEFRIARQMDPLDPTPWLYEGIWQAQYHHYNEAIQSMEKSIALNKHLLVQRSRHRLDSDRAVQSADVAAVYQSIGFREVARRRATEALDSDYSNAAGHLFLSRVLAESEDRLRFDHRLEPERNTEWLLANLLASTGAGNLSQLVSQQDHLHAFETPALGGSALTEYRSSGDWAQTLSTFGHVADLGYALDGQWVSAQGDGLGSLFESRRIGAQVQQRIGWEDSLLLQMGAASIEGRDVARRYDPSEPPAGRRAKEVQEPQLNLGWHHQWTPENHTLLLVSGMENRFTLDDPQPSTLLMRQLDGKVTSVRTDPFLHLDLAQTSAMHSVELQQIAGVGHHQWIVGMRYQNAEISARSKLSRELSGLVTDQTEEGQLERFGGYLYDRWQPIEWARLLYGIGIDELRSPSNVDLPPIDLQPARRFLVEPKLGFTLGPWNGARIRGSFTRSLGGFHGESSMSLEPTQVSGFSQRRGNLGSEAEVGIVPGATHEVAGVGIDQDWGGKWFAGLEVRRERTQGTREAGVLLNSTPLPLFDTPGSTRENLSFEERSMAAYLSTLISRAFSTGLRLQLLQGELQSRFPELDRQVIGNAELERTLESRLLRWEWFGDYQFQSGVFVQGEIQQFIQWNHGYTPNRTREYLWQENVFVGYRFPRNSWIVRVGLLNLGDADYRLSPMNGILDLPRGRMATVSLRANF